MLDYPPNSLLSLKYKLTTPHAKGTIKITTSGTPLPKNSNKPKPHWGTKSDPPVITQDLKEKDTLVFTSGVEGTNVCIHVLGVTTNSASTGVGVSLSLKRGNPHDSTSDLVGVEAVAESLRELNERVEFMLSKGDRLKVLEAKFHEQSESMNKASLCWPLVQIGVIMLTATGWVGGVVGFFRKRKIV